MNLLLLRIKSNSVHVFAVFLLAGCAVSNSSSSGSIEQFTSTTLKTFESERRFRHYLRTVRAEALEKGLWWAGNRSVGNSSDILEEIQVTAFRVVDSGYITNNQNIGVDEGDIVKQAGRYVLLLSDGRLFSIDTGEEHSELRLVDRLDVYRSTQADTWYDEMLIQHNRIVVTGYNYDQDATEVSLFTIEGDGSIKRGDVYYLSSNDYYDTENYASRLVGDKLVFYSPIYLNEINPSSASMPWPLIRRWLPGDDERRRTARAEPIFDARSVYYPIQPTLQPVVHSISICDLGRVGSKNGLLCSATAVVGTAIAEFLVTNTDAWLWLVGDAYELGDPGDEELERSCQEPAFNDSDPAALFRLPLDGAVPQAIHVRGRPRNQFALESAADEFRALLYWGEYGCGEQSQMALRYFSTPLATMSSHPISAPAASFLDLPAVSADDYENRFAGSHLIYAASTGWDSYPPEPGEEVRESRVIAMSLSAPHEATVLNAPHDVMRIERAGDNAVLTGYHDAAGLNISILQLGNVPNISSSALLPQRYESEGRSHAFNSRLMPDGSVLMGLPTTIALAQSGRYWWESDNSDISFLLSSPEGILRPLGDLVFNKDEGTSNYECVVSCTDWYGNARPFFINDRIYALTGVELIEGHLVDGKIEELRRIDLTVLPTH